MLIKTGLFLQKTSPMLSSKAARRWFNSYIAGTKPTVKQLKTLLIQGYQSKYIDDADLKRILATYGLD